MIVSSPVHAAEDPDRPSECEEAIEAAIVEIERAAIEAGWKEIEIAIAMVDLGTAKLKNILENAQAGLSPSFRH